jgi:uncharacterized protein YbjT (DUF2867 family)
MQNFITIPFRHSIKGTAFYLPLGDARASFVDIRDVAEVAARILNEQSNKHYDMIYDITGRQHLNCGDISEILKSILGLPIDYVPISEQTAKRELILAGLKPESIVCFLNLYRIIREDHMRRISKAVETVLGRKPISFETFVRDHIELFKKRLNPISSQ